MVVLSLSDLGNRKIKARFLKIFSIFYFFAQDADLWQRKRMVSQLVMEGEVGFDNFQF